MATPYLVGVGPNVSFQVIATVGDVVGTKPDSSDYRMVGIPDGLGAFDNGDGTITVVMNHELGATAGIVREHGAKGAFVSQWVLNKSDLSIVSTEDAIKQVLLWDDATETFVDATYAIGRLCSADLAPVSAYEWTDADTGITYGTSDRIFATGEENGSEGKEFGLVLTGDDAGKAFELAHMGLFSWENAISSPFAQKKTINIGLDDSNGGQLYVYVGEKQTTGNAVEKAGLVGGTLYGIRALNLDANGNLEDDANAASGRFELVDEGDVSKLTGVELEALSDSKGVTGFFRPEDGQFDPTDPNVFYFVTTASFTNISRLYKMTFDDITNPEAGGTIEAVLDSNDLPTNGTVGPRMMDNVTVNAEGKIIIQEDPGNQTHLAKMFEYDPVTDTLTVIGEANPELFLAGAPGFKTHDEEHSGVIDVTDLIGDADTKAYLLDVQSHNGLADPELVQDGQFLAMFVDQRFVFGTEGNDTYQGKNGTDIFFFDNSAASGHDRIVNFGKLDLIVTSQKLFDSNDDGIVTFGKDKLLDVSFDDSDVKILDGQGKLVTRVEYDGSYEANGHTYYVYSHVGSDVGVETVTGQLVENQFLA